VAHESDQSHPSEYASHKRVADFLNFGTFIIDMFPFRCDIDGFDCDVILVSGFEYEKSKHFWGTQVQMGLVRFGKHMNCKVLISFFLFLFQLFCIRRI
jgi:hypothetical protein